MIDIGNIRLGQPKAEGAIADRRNLVVHPFHGAVGDPDAGPGQYSVEASPEYSGELLEGLQPAVAGAPAPLARVGLSPGGAAAVLEATEVLLEQVRLHDGAVQPQEYRQPGVSVTATEEESNKSEARVNDIFFGPLERRVLQSLCRHMPAWVNPDILTAVGVGGGLIIAVGYWLTNFDNNFLWLVDFGFVVNWLGDSLDGTLARHRKIERFKYGYFIDHTVDTFTQTMVCIGLGLSPFVGFNYAMLALVSYLQLGILTYVNTAVTGVFKISYGKIGPTEVRVIVIGVNAFFYFANNPMIHSSFINISLFNLIILGIAAAFFIHFIVMTIKQAVCLNEQERSKKHSYNLL